MRRYAWRTRSEAPEGEPLAVVTGERVLETTLPADAAFVREARELVADVARPYVSREGLVALRLLLSEVVAHAVRGGGRSRLSLSVTAGDAVYVEVRRPGGRFRSRAAGGGTDATVGLALDVIGHLAERWDVEGGPHGRIWFSVPRWPNGRAQIRTR